MSAKGPSAGGTSAGILLLGMCLGWVCFNLPFFAVPILGTYAALVLLTIAWFQVSAGIRRERERRVAKREAEEAERALARARAEAESARKRQTRESEISVRDRFRGGFEILKGVGSTIAASELSRAKSVFERGRVALRRSSPSEIIAEEASKLFEYSNLSVAFYWQRAFSEPKGKSPLLIIQLSGGVAIEEALKESDGDPLDLSPGSQELKPYTVLADRIRKRTPLFKSSVILVVAGVAYANQRNKIVLESFVEMSMRVESQAEDESNRRWLPQYNAIWSISGNDNPYSSLGDVISDLETRPDNEVWSESSLDLRDFAETSASLGKSAKDVKSPDIGFARTLDDRDAIEKALQEKIIGQRAAILVIATAVATYKRKINSARSPLVFMLPGPTGTGKTEITKALAAALDGVFVRFDMGEFASEHSESNLFGSKLGYHGSDKGGALANAVRATSDGKPLMILFDEVEKAHPSIWQSSLAFFDEGRVTDARGSVQAPHPTILVMTTNKAAQSIADDPDNAKDILRQTGSFSDEFMGRVKRVVPMLRLSQSERQMLVERMVTNLGSEYGLEIAFDDEVIALLLSQISESDHSSGGRGVRDKIEDILNLEFSSFADSGKKSAKLTFNSEGHFILVSP